MNLYNYILENVTIDRSKLPYREAIDVFIFHEDKLVGQKILRDKNKPNEYFLKTPSGGIDEGESIIEAAKRETIEETGAVLKNIKEVESFKVIWPPSFKNASAKTARRYAKYKGINYRVIVAELVKFIDPTSKEGDEWSGTQEEKLMTIEEAIELLKNDKAEKIWQEYNQLNIKLTYSHD